VTVDLPPIPASPTPAPDVTTTTRPPGSVPPGLARLAAHHPVVIATIIVTIVLTWMTVVASVVALAAQSWWVFDILTSYRPQFALASMVAVVALAALRCWRTLIVAVLALGLNAALVAPVFTGQQRAARPHSPTLTIAHLNLQSRTGNIPQMQAWLETKPADLVVLLHAGAGTATDLRAGVGVYHMVFPTAVSISATGHIKWDPISPETIVLSRRNDVHAERPYIPALPGPSVVITTHLGGTEIHLLGTHSMSPGTAKRVVTRDAQLTGIANWLRDSPTPAVAFGDFNVTYYSPKMKDVLARAHATSSQLGFGIQATWPHQFRPAGIAIDQSIYRGDITAVARHRGPSMGSEHRALIVTYALTD
jgi:endonuclease/exonuclease/phosphatase (EEP) superfamily protein YafD